MKFIFRKNDRFILLRIPVKPNIAMRLFIVLLICLSVCSSKVVAQKVADSTLKTRINHIAVYVYDLERSRHFYENIV